MILAPDLRWGPGLLGSLVDNAIGSSPLAASDPLAKNVSFSVDQSLGTSRQDYLRFLTHLHFFIRLLGQASISKVVL